MTDDCLFDSRMVDWFGRWEFNSDNEQRVYIVSIIGSVRRMKGLQQLKLTKRLPKSDTTLTRHV